MATQSLSDFTPSLSLERGLGGDLNLKPLDLPGIEQKRPLVIAGPCSAESEQQVMDTAQQLANNGIRIFRAGVWKPRTKPGGFEGKGKPALPWLQRVKAETGC